MGKLLQIHLSEYQLSLGIQQPFLSAPFAHYAKFVDNYWLTLVWQYVGRIRLKIDVEDHWAPTISRVVEQETLSSWTTPLLSSYTQNQSSC
jgi:hypothetical protein